MTRPTSETSRGGDDLSLFRSGNFRDIAGPGDGYAAGGGRIRRGAIYRSGCLDVAAGPQSEIAVLREVFDLRTSRERLERPDAVFPGVDYHAIDIIGDDAAAPLLALTADLSRLRSADDSVATAQGIYRGFVAGARQRRGYRWLLEAVARSDGSIVVHCTAGKDRTGWATALLHYIAGVDHSDILSDYLMTNVCAKDAIAKALDKVRRSDGARAATAFEPFLRVDASYLDAALDEASHRYGGLDGYLTTGLGVIDATLEQIRAKLVRRQ